MNPTASYKKICSMIIIFAMALFLFLLRYNIPLYGDDVLGLVTNNLGRAYLDDYVAVEECELYLDYSPSATWDTLVDSYFTWDGRVTSKFMMSLVRMIFSLPDRVGWFSFGIYITVMQLLLLFLLLQIICGSIRNGLETPAIVLLTGALVIFVPSYSYAYMSRIVMYTFTNIYVVSVVLYLLFYTLIRRAFERNACPSSVAYVGINVVGLLAGLSHEAYGVIFGAVLFTQLGIFWFKNHRRISARYLLMYIGYIIGYCICFFAPGNFNRAQQSHESALGSIPIMARMFNSFYIHAYVMYQVWIVPLIVIPVLIVTVIILLKKNVIKIKDIIAAILNNLEWFVGFAASAIVWGLVALVAIYGMLAANVLLIIGIIGVFRELWLGVKKRIMLQERQSERLQKVFAGLSIFGIVILLIMNYSDASSAYKVADVWRSRIDQARESGAEKVVVPAYPENLNYKFYDIDALNNQAYDDAAHCAVYGTYIQIE